jgi:hypothetical protein
LRRGKTFPKEAGALRRLTLALRATSMNHRGAVSGFQSISAALKEVRADVVKKAMRLGEVIGLANMDKLLKAQEG